MTVTSKTLVLIDADQFFYQHTSAAEEEVCFDDTSHPNAWMLEMDTYLLSNTKQVSESLQSALVSATKGYDEAILCFTSTPNFRHDCLSTYKGGRVKKRKPIGYWALVDKYLEDSRWVTKKIPGLEADDVMSIVATHPRYRKDYPGGITIVSNDKDMRQVFDTPIVVQGRRQKPVSLAAANQWRYVQALAGDATDGYAGLAGYGKVKAERYLEEHYGADEQVLIDTVVSAYLDAGERLQTAYSQLNCARILRYGEYDFKNMRPLLLGR